MPIEGVLVLGIPVPFAVAPEPGNSVAEFCFLGRWVIEVGAHAEQSLEEVGRFYNIAAIVFSGKGDGFAGFAVEPMGEYAMVMVGFGQEFYTFEQVCYNVFALEPAAINTHDECHKAHARATGGDHFVAVIVGDVTAFAG